MKTEFTESSYAFAVTSELANGALGVATAAPVIPSLQAEGSSGGGYDVKIPLNPVPLFLQFKVPTVLKRSSHLRPISFPIPYYRIHLRTNSPNQHKLLLDLEGSGNFVFYASPRFHEAAELDRLYLGRKIALNSIYLRPGDIGRLDTKKHHIAYCDQPHAWVHSEPKLIDNQFFTEETFSLLREKVSEAPIQDSDSFLKKLSNDIISTVNRFSSDFSDDAFDQLVTVYDVESEEEYDRIPDKPFVPLKEGTRTLRELSQIAQTYLGAQLFILGSKFVDEN